LSGRQAVPYQAKYYFPNVDLAVRARVRLSLTLIETTCPTHCGEMMPQHWRH
jgi:hypothetical protein